MLYGSLGRIELLHCGIELLLKASFDGRCCSKYSHLLMLELFILIKLTWQCCYLTITGDESIVVLCTCRLHFKYKMFSHYDINALFMKVEVLAKMLVDSVCLFVF